MDPVDDGGGRAGDIGPGPGGGGGGQGKPGCGRLPGAETARMGRRARRVPRGLHLGGAAPARSPHRGSRSGLAGGVRRCDRDRKSTRLNSSHVKISYAVFCLKKKRQLMKFVIILYL